MAWSDVEPKLLTVWREGLTRAQLVQDALAGLVVGVVALPLAIAFAIASGVRPEQGLYTAIIAGFLISALGGSRVQIGGPTGAFVVIIYGVVERFGYDGLAVATLMAGVLLVGFGVGRLGAVIRFIPYPVTVGFTSGIAVLIASGQVRDALGLQMEKVPAEMLEAWPAYVAHSGSTNLWALALCLGSVVLVQLWPRISARVPGPLVALLGATALTQLFDLPVETIGSRFGGIPTALPSLRLPQVDWNVLPDLVSPALTIALLGGIESLLSAVVADGMTGRRHRSNTELVAQGVANIVAPLFGGIPATGAIARTATNVKNGGRTPIAGIVHALVLLLILWFAGHWAGLIPMATLAGILLVVAYNMSEWHLFLGLLRGPRSDVLVLVVTFLLTVLVDLTVAIQAGVVLAALLFMRRMAEVSEVEAITAQVREDEEAPTDATTSGLGAGIEVFTIQGTFFFGAAQKFSRAIAEVENRPKVVILELQRVLVIDATGLRALEEILARFQRDGTALILAGLRDRALATVRQCGLFEKLGADNVVVDLATALRRAEHLRSQA